MKTASTLLSATLLSFAAIACQQTSATNNEVNANAAATADVETLPADEGNPSIEPTDNEVNAVANGSAPADGVLAIPAQYRGRWGMVAADCDPSRADNKGLITIGDKTIRFYESTATLNEQRPAIATSFAGLYGFTGEGQTWEKVVTLTRTGDKLKRADDEGSYNYTRCA